MLLSTLTNMKQSSRSGTGQLQQHSASYHRYRVHYTFFGHRFVHGFHRTVYAEWRAFNVMQKK